MRLDERVWPGWIGSMPDDGTTYRLTWSGWRAWQSRRHQPQHSGDGMTPRRQREVATSSFLLWFDDAASGRDGPPPEDRTLAARSFLRHFDDVIAAQGEPHARQDALLAAGS